jgi:hypothetical protein
MKTLLVVLILGILSLGVAFGDTVKVTVKRERTPEREYYQQNSTGGVEKVKEYPGGVTVKEGFRYEAGKGIVKYNEPVPKPFDGKEKPSGKSNRK